MLGHKLVQILNREFDIYTTLRGKFSNYEKFGIFKRDKTFENVSAGDLEKVEQVITNVKPDVIINAIGIIKQLPDSKNTIEVLRINSIFPHQLAELAGESGARLINISTDCVFDGKKGLYTETDIPNAADLYGKSKNLGEVTGENCLTIRTSIIGRELETKHSLIEWFLQNEDEKIEGFLNAVFSGFPTIVMAEIIADIIKNHEDLGGLYHVSSEPINKFDLLNLVKDAYQIEKKIEPFRDFKIDRSLDSTKFRTETNFKPQSWKEMIQMMRKDSDSYLRNSGGKRI